jgi:hypothetical protein
MKTQVTNYRTKQIKNLAGYALALACTVLASSLTAQESERSGEETEGNVKVILMTNDNGKITEVKQTFSSEDDAEIKELLEKHGVQLEEGDKGYRYQFKVDEAEGDQDKEIKLEIIEDGGGSGKNIKIFKKRIMEEHGPGEHSQEHKGTFIRIDEETEGDVKVMNFTMAPSMDENSPEDGEVIIEEFKFKQEGTDKIETMVFIRKTTERGEEVLESMPTRIKDKLESSSAIQELQLYPNPVNDKFTMSFVAKETRDYNLSIVDAKGSVIYEKQLPAYEGTYKEDFDFSAYESGVYFFNLVSSGEKISKKIIVK